MRRSGRWAAALVLIVLAATVGAQRVGVRRDRLGAFGAITSASVMSIRSVGGALRVRSLTTAQCAQLDGQLRSRREPVLGGGCTLVTFRLVVGDAACRTLAFQGNSGELHPAGPCPAAILELARELEDGVTDGWSTRVAAPRTD